jgi:hypothetical protein
MPKFKIGDYVDIDTDFAKSVITDELIATKPATKPVNKPYVAQIMQANRDGTYDVEFTQYRIHPEPEVYKDMTVKQFKSIKPMLGAVVKITDNEITKKYKQTDSDQTNSAQTDSDQTNSAQTDSDQTNSAQTDSDVIYGKITGMKDSTYDEDGNSNDDGNYDVKITPKVIPGPVIINVETSNISVPSSKFSVCNQVVLTDENKRQHLEKYNPDVKNKTYFKIIRLEYNPNSPNVQKEQDDGYLYRIRYDVVEYQMDDEVASSQIQLYDPLQSEKGGGEEYARPSVLPK